MKKFIILIPLIATTFYEVEAESEDEAFEMAVEAYDSGRIDLQGFDNEPISDWWVEEVED